jgi:hypothetical protein
MLFWVSEVLLSRYEEHTSGGIIEKFHTAISRATSYGEEKYCGSIRCENYWKKYYINQVVPDRVPSMNHSLIRIRIFNYQENHYLLYVCII